MLDVAMSPTALQLPALSACRDSATLTVRLQNYVTDTVRIVAVRASRLRVATGTADTGLAAPIVLPPGELAVVRVRITVPFDGIVSDTIAFVDARCGRQYGIHVAGKKGGLVANPATVVDLGAIASCSSGASTTAVLGLQNTGSESVDITGIEVFGVGTIDADLPVSLAGGAAITIPMRLDGITAGSGSLGNIRLAFSSPSCSGRTEIQTTSKIFSYQIQHPDTVVFGPANVGTSAITRAASVLAGVEGALRSLNITQVGVRGPFSTTLRPGAELLSGRSTPFSVTFHPDRVEGQGVVLGSLDFSIDSCATTYTVQLRAAYDATTSVQLTAAGPIGVSHGATAGTITVTTEHAATVVLSDIVGRTLQRLTIPGGVSVLPVSEIRPTILIVTVIGQTATVQRMVLLE
jgi:hypothetical protein